MRTINYMIGIPTVNRADLLNQALLRYFDDFRSIEIAICDNGNQDIFTKPDLFMIYRPPENLGVAKSWNMLMDYAEKKGYSHVLMLNDDIYIGRNQTMIEHLIAHSPENSFIKTKQNWSAFILSVETWKDVGGFDENFGLCYFEDNDFHYRMTMKGVTIITTPILDPQIYRNSMSIKADRNLNRGFMDNQRYYISKWGGMPMKETFTKPFNGKEYSK